MTTSTNTDKTTTPTAEAETKIWGAPQLTIEQMSKLSPQDLDSAHKAGKLKAIIDGDNEKLLEVRKDLAAPATADPKAPAEADSETDTEAEAEQPADNWHEQMKNKYGVDQLTLAEAEQLGKDDPDELKRLSAAGSIKAIAAGNTGPTK